jgi:mono/diheme cytochrome c family protein
MTRNLTIATFFLLASTLLLGFVWVREHAVLDDRAARFEGGLTARGARDFEQYCAPCHGLTGEGGVANGAPQINNLPNTLGDRLDGANGITAKYGTVRNFVEATITSGVRGTAMPRWSARLGGPLRDDQITDIAAYIQGWWGPQGGQPNISPDAVAAAAAYKKAQQALASAGAPDTPVGRGQALFQSNCQSCHNLNDKDSGVPAPGLGGLFGPDGTAAYGKKLPNGKDVTPADFFEWVKKGGAAFKAQAIEPQNGAAYVIEVMPPFPQLTDQQLADLLAFISAHDRSGEQKLPPIGPDGNPLPQQGGNASGAPAAQPTPSGNVQPNAAPGNNATATP